MVMGKNTIKIKLRKDWKEKENENRLSANCMLSAKSGPQHIMHILLILHNYPRRRYYNLHFASEKKFKFRES